MAKPKRTNLATILKLLPVLTDEDRATLRDMLRPEPTKRSATKKAGKKPKAAEATLPLINDAGDENQSDGPICGACGNVESYQDHYQPSPHYHEFEPPKGASKKVAA